MSRGTGSPSSSYASGGSLSGLGLGSHRTKSYGVAGIVNGQRENRRRAAAMREDDDGLNGVWPTNEVSVTYIRSSEQHAVVGTPLFVSRCQR